MNPRKYILLLLVILTLFIVAYDYTTGHSRNDIVTVTTCPLCVAFMSTMAGCTLVCILMLLGLIDANRRFYTADSAHLFSLILSYEAPDRAPPSIA